MNDTQDPLEVKGIYSLIRKALPKLTEDWPGRAGERG